MKQSISRPPKNCMQRCINLREGVTIDEVQCTVIELPYIRPRRHLAEVMLVSIQGVAIGRLPTRGKDKSLHGGCRVAKEISAALEASYMPNRCLVAPRKAIHQLFTASPSSGCLSP